MNKEESIKQSALIVEKIMQYKKLLEIRIQKDYGIGINVKVTINNFPFHPNIKGREMFFVNGQEYLITDIAIASYKVCPLHDDLFIKFN